ncbi:GGDEF domain-containing protein [Novosphingobium rosa]|uniref:GGDEF domain-containing protein n=1 Tax=Novosphingobium rosa TaxID=76978 RepID=UPI00082F60DD|nr:diguanylate cyclase [Novosphingobium rosa]
MMCHAFAGQAIPEHKSVVSLGFLTLAPLIAGLLCWWRGRAGAAQGWLLLALAMLLWAGGMAANVLVYLALGNVTGESIASMLLFVLYGVPIIFATASPTSEAWPVRLVDAILAAALGGLFFAHTSTFSTMAGASVEGAGKLARMFDIENVFIAVFALVRFSACRDAAERAFFKALSVYALLYLMTAAYINHWQENADFGDMVDVIIDLPFLALMVMAAHAQPTQDRPVQIPLRRERLVQAASPLMLPATLLAVATALVWTHPVWTMAGFALATLVYGLRNILAHLRNLEERDRLDALSRTDGLTALPNRRSFDVALQAEWARACRSGGSLAILMIDIDHFKQLNDRFGHPEGDCRLRDVAKALASCATRAGDFVARYGGEEFVAILPACDAHQARDLAEIMRLCVLNMALPSPAEGGVVTVSIGVGWGRMTKANTPEALLSRADEALYEAKRGGRNAVRLLEDLPFPNAAPG